MSFPFVHRETVRFRDVDVLGHVNNAVYLTYLEQARVAFLSPHDADWTQMILARCEIDFRAQVAVGEVVEIALWPTRVGNKSFALSYELKVNDRIVAEAKTVLVAFDY
ncbi:MAG: acyl-CoA thioesterase, partial [Actinobacteria bacterium]|nr:acyl-CoA thioesterase [Actinomycetota bacterium]